MHENQKEPEDFGAVRIGDSRPHGTRMPPLSNTGAQRAATPLLLPPSLPWKTKGLMTQTLSLYGHPLFQGVNPRREHHI